MKLLLCLDCESVISLTDRGERKCPCGKSSGRYIPAEISRHIEYSGPCKVIGFRNRSLITAIANDGNFDAFIIPESSEYIKKIG